MKSHTTKQLLTSISVDIRIHLPEKMIFTEAAALGRGEYHALRPLCISLFRVDKKYTSFVNKLDTQAKMEFVL